MNPKLDEPYASGCDPVIKAYMVLIGSPAPEMRFAKGTALAMVRRSCVIGGPLSKTEGQPR